jgi:hypothetical protein
MRVRAGAFGDVAELAAYDMIVGAHGAFAQLLTPGERAMVLRRCHRALLPGGVLVLDQSNLLRALREFAPVRVLWGGRGTNRVRLVRRQQVNEHTATLEVQELYELVRGSGGEQPAGPRLARLRRYAITTFPELAYLLHDAGFGTAESYTSYAARRPERVRGERLLVVAGKEEASG